MTSTIAQLNILGELLDVYAEVGLPDVRIQTRQRVNRLALRIPLGGAHP